VHHVAARGDEHATLAQRGQRRAERDVVGVGLGRVDRQLDDGDVGLGEHVGEHRPGAVVEAPAVVVLPDPDRRRDLGHLGGELGRAGGGVLEREQLVGEAVEVVDGPRALHGRHRGSVDVPVGRDHQDRPGSAVLAHDLLTHRLPRLGVGVVLQRVHRAAVPEEHRRHGAVVMIVGGLGHGGLLLVGDPCGSGKILAGTSISAGREPSRAWEDRGMQPAERIRAYFEACNGGDPDAVAVHFTPDAVVYDTNIPPMRGRDAIAAGWAAIAAKWGGATWSVDSVVEAADGSCAAIEWSMTGTDPRSGASFVFRGSEHYRFADGLIDEIRQYWTFDRDRLDSGLVGYPYG
jgi:ketosteroid isomerase-like protein